MTKSQRNYSVTRKELLALVYFAHHVRCYLLGRHFIARTDHAALKGLQTCKEPEGQLACWIEQLQEFDFYCKHRAGGKHQNTDTLSRHPHVKLTPTNDQNTNGCQDPQDPQFLVCAASPNWARTWLPTELMKEQKADPVLTVVHQWLKCGKDRLGQMEFQGAGEELRGLWAQWDRLELEHRVIYRIWENDSGETHHRQLVLPRVLIPTILQSLHNGLGGDLLGFAKMLAKVRERFYWYRLREDVQK